MKPNTPISRRHIHFSIQLNTLKVASNIHNHARPLSTVGTMNGSSTVARVKRASRNLRFSRMASHMPNTALMTVAAMVKMTVFHAAWWKISLLSSLAKLASPTKLPGVPTTLSVSDIHTPRENG